MLRESKAFSGVLTRIGSKAIDENVVLSFNIRHIEEGDIQTFLDSYEKKCELENIKCLFQYPVQWKSVHVESRYKFRIEFDEIECEGILLGIKVRRSYKKGSEFFTYDLEFQKEMEKDSDLFLSTYLNQKEEDENGKKALIQYSVYLTPLEKIEEKLTSEMLTDE